MLGRWVEGEVLRRPHEPTAFIISDNANYNSIHTLYDHTMPWSVGEVMR
jgi:hypothetical protein